MIGRPPTKIIGVFRGFISVFDVGQMAIGLDDLAGSPVKIVSHQNGFPEPSIRQFQEGGLINGIGKIERPVRNRHLEIRKFLLAFHHVLSHAVELLREKAFRCKIVCLYQSPMACLLQCASAGFKAARIIECPTEGP